MILDNKKEDINRKWLTANIGSLILNHASEKSRIENLRNYYLGDHDILDRTMSNTYVANEKLVNNFPKYITTVSVGYFMGNPIDYMANKITLKKSIDDLKKVMRKGDIESVDIDVAINCSIAGVGYEFINSFTDFDNETIPKSYSLLPERSFVAYSNTIEATPLFGVYYVDSADPITKNNTTFVTVATDNRIYTFKTNGNKVYTWQSTKEHYFGIVPIIEYKNNSDLHGDFQDVISLVDAYNLLQSDRINDKEQLIDAILLLTGANLEDNKFITNIKENRILVLPDTDSKAEWLTKQLDEEDTDVLRKSIESDIHKFSLTPNITDEQFSGNASGAAMEYKLFGFEQLIKTKERFFQESLRTRLIAYLTFIQKQNKLKGLTVDAIEFIFNRNLPTNDLEIAQMVNQLRNLVSNQSLLGQIPFVKDVDVEMAKVEKQKEERQKEIQNTLAFPDVNGDPNVDNQDNAIPKE